MISSYQINSVALALANYLAYNDESRVIISNGIVSSKSYPEIAVAKQTLVNSICFAYNKSSFDDIHKTKDALYYPIVDCLKEIYHC